MKKPYHTKKPSDLGINFEKKQKKFEKNFPAQELNKTEINIHDVVVLTKNFPKVKLFKDDICIVDSVYKIDGKLHYVLIATRTKGTVPIIELVPEDGIIKMPN